MTPLFYEDSLGAKLVEKAKASAAAAEKARASRANEPMPARGSADLDLIDDPAALDAAERVANGEDPEAVYAEVTSDWVPVFGPSKLSGFWDVAGVSASKITMPLESAGIRFAWDPYPPEEMPGVSAPFLHLIDRPFTLLVAPDDADAARTLLSAIPGGDTQFGLPATVDDEPEPEESRFSVLAMALIIVVVVALVATGLVFVAF